MSEEPMTFDGVFYFRVVRDGQRVGVNVDDLQGILDAIEPPVGHPDRAEWEKCSREFAANRAAFSTPAPQ